MIYSVDNLTFPTDTNAYTLAPGVLGAFRIVVTPGVTITISLNQLLPNTMYSPQDFSMKGWISKFSGGSSVISTPEVFSRWFLTTLQKTVVTIYDSTANLGPFSGIAIGLIPDTYCLNVLNVVNEANSFALDITEI